MLLHEVYFFRFCWQFLLKRQYRKADHLAVYITDPLEQGSICTDFKVEAQSKDMLSGGFVSEGWRTFLLLDILIQFFFSVLKSQTGHLESSRKS